MTVCGSSESVVRSCDSRDGTSNFSVLTQISGILPSPTILKLYVNVYVH